MTFENSRHQPHVGLESWGSPLRGVVRGVVGGAFPRRGSRSRQTEKEEKDPIPTIAAAQGETVPWEPSRTPFTPYGNYSVASKKLLVM